MAITHTQSNQANTDASGTTQTVALTGVAAGSLITFSVRHEGGASTVTIAETTGGTAAATMRTALNDGPSLRQGYILAGTGGNITYTVTWSPARAYRVVVVREFLYAGTASFDVAPTGDGAAGGSATTSASGDFASATTGTDEVLVAAVALYNTAGANTERINATVPSGVRDTAVYLDDWYLIVTTSGITGGSTVTHDTSTSWAHGLMSFKAVASGAGLTFAATDAQGTQADATGGFRTMAATVTDNLNA